MMGDEAPSAGIPAVVEALVQQRLGVFPGFYAPDLVAALREELLSRVDQGSLIPAGVGKGCERQRIEAIRGDFIHWLNGETPAQRAFLAIMEALRQTLNRELFLGLEDLECHFAHYAPGAGYGRHLDSFRNNNRRRVTVVSYLNPDWGTEDGGDLVIFDGEREVGRVAPLGGTLVCFVSDEIPHQVEPTRRPRVSIAGWFRVRG